MASPYVRQQEGQDAKFYNNIYTGYEDVIITKCPGSEKLAFSSPSSWSDGALRLPAVSAR